jgi:hypothetical protein
MNILQLVILLCSIESGGRINPPPGDNGKAIGCLQIHPIMKREVNRIIGYKRFTCADRRDPVKSYAMAITYLRRQKRRYEVRHGRSPSKALLMRSWNAGSIFKPCTKDYKRKVDRALNK